MDSSIFDFSYDRGKIYVFGVYCVSCDLKDNWLRYKVQWLFKLTHLIVDIERFQHLNMIISITLEADVIFQFR